MQKQYDLIVWDWDGTLADSTGMITNALVKAAQQVGLPALDPAKATSIIGLGLRESIYALFGDLPEAQARDLAAQYNTNYYAGESEIPLFPGASDTIIELNKRGYKLAVATGKGRRGLNLALQHSGLTQYFHATKTVDECFSKPHPQMLDALMDELVVMPERTLMIGDTHYDLQMAKNAGVHTAAVTYGAQSAVQLSPYSPEYVFNSFHDLSTWLLDESH
ncbi:HAD family hydrolase [Methylotenera sp. 1P/1]|jgi:phosphoglycolate phosphatase|uniref:HAD family hydrolase n=1 Tax=Methylotenera sp. 1P/1 TaxID=1131551 RepID=UPI0003727F33|nr:HAD-IIIA family hydrolase [Methylotenera sp. 1P/1]